MSRMVTSPLSFSDVFFLYVRDLGKRGLRALLLNFRLPPTSTTSHPILKKKEKDWDNPGLFPWIILTDDGSSVPQHCV